MVLYSISDIVPFKSLEGVTLSNVKNVIRSKMAETYPDCIDFQSDFKDEDIALTFQQDGIFYKLDVEA